MGFSYNAKRYSDPIYEYAHGNTANPRVLFKQITWRDNAFFTARNERERLDWKRDEPETYQHEWEGVPYGDGDVRKVITYEMAMACVNAWKEWVVPNNYQPSGRVDVGLGRSGYRNGPKCTSSAQRAGTVPRRAV